MNKIKSLRLKYRVKSHGDDLFAALRENPHDWDTFAILGDWLEEQGDPTAEVVRDVIMKEEDPEGISIRFDLTMERQSLRERVIDLVSCIERDQEEINSWKINFEANVEEYSEDVVEDQIEELELRLKHFMDEHEDIARQITLIDRLLEKLHPNQVKPV